MTANRSGLIWVAAAVTAAAVAAVPATAGPGKKPVSFSGDCEFAGTVAFDPPMTNEPQTVQQRAKAPGTCSGTFVDRKGREHQLDGARVTYRATAGGDAVSCASGTPSGGGALVFRRGRLRFAMSEARVGPLATVSLRGRRSGSATFVVTPRPDGDPVALLQKCAGSGIERVELVGRLSSSGISG